MSAGSIGGGGGASVGNPVSGATANRVLFSDTNGDLADDPDLYFDSSTNLFRRTHTHSDSNPSSAGIETAILNSTANVLWFHLLGSGSIRRAAIGWTTVAGDDALNCWGANYVRFLAGSATERMRVSGVAGVLGMSAIQNLKAADLASASTLTLDPLLGDSRDITGTTTINHITTTNWQAGALIRLQFDASVTVTHNAGSPPGGTVPILLSGAANLSATAGDTLTLWYDSAAFREMARTVI